MKLPNKPLNLQEHSQKHLGITQVMCLHFIQLVTETEYLISGNETKSHQKQYIPGHRHDLHFAVFSYGLVQVDFALILHGNFIGIRSNEATLNNIDNCTAQFYATKKKKKKKKKNKHSKVCCDCFCGGIKLRSDFIDIFSTGLLH